MNCLLIAVCFGWTADFLSAVEPFRVVELYPGNKTAEIELDPMIQIHVSEKFDPASVVDGSVVLRGSDGVDVPVNVGGDLGGVITVSVDHPLRANQEYTLLVTSNIKSRLGTPIEPSQSKFRTTSQASAAARDDISDFRFSKTKLDERDGITGLALVGSRTLFACTWDGQLIRYRLTHEGGLNDAPEILITQRRRFNAIVAAPEANDAKTVLWLSHDAQFRLSIGPNDFSGTISKVTIENRVVHSQDVITGLPTGDHPASGLTFGPDGRLYVSQGALSMLGGKPENPETPLSAATLAIDLNHPLWNSGSAVDVSQFTAETNPSAIEVFATGIREAYDLCWHSRGQLFAGVNMNDTNDLTPGRTGLPAVNVRPAEMMLRIVHGMYYGHPNPARNQWVLLGGNPTAEIDPWEVRELPVGTQPEPNFDPGLFIRNLEEDKGPSANGVCEFKSDGPLKERLLFCFYTATRGIHTYRVSDDGRKVSDPQPLVDTNDLTLRFGAPLDIVDTQAGQLFVADFSAPERGDSGKRGGVWLVKPAAIDSAAPAHKRKGQR